MGEIDDIVTFMDVLDFDEEVVDLRLKTLMDRERLTLQHLSNVISLLNYKCLLNIKESDECDNEHEFEFVGKLIKDLNEVPMEEEENIKAISKILYITLSLQPSSIKYKAEHLLQQLLCSIADLLETIGSDENHNRILLCLKLCDSILDAVSKYGEKLMLPFLDVPLEKIALCQYEKLKTHFLTVTVKRFFDAVEGYNILDRIWDCIKLECSKLQTLKALCTLSNYYIPLPYQNGDILYKSNVVMQPELWDLSLFGLSSDDASTRKLAMYLIKRAIDYLKISKLKLVINAPTVTVTWISDNEFEMTKLWDNFFILMDSLEEKQSNIVLPSLQLFDHIGDIGRCWLNCAYNVGLQHDNMQVKIKCAMYRLQTPTSTDKEAVVLLESLNDMNIYDNENQCDLLKIKLQNHLSDVGSFVNIIKNIPKVKWSPVPIYHLSTTMASMDSVYIIDKTEKQDLTGMLSDLVKVPCNNIMIRKAFHRNLSHLIGVHCRDLEWKPLLSIYHQLEADLWKTEENNPLVSLVKEKINIQDKKYFFVEIVKSHLNTDFLLLYLSGHEDEVDLFLEVLNNMFEQLDSANKNISISTNEDVIKAVFLTHLSSRIHIAQSSIYYTLQKNNSILFNYIFTVLNTDIKDVDNVVLFLDHIQNTIQLNKDPATVTKLFNQVLTTLKNNINLYKNIYSIYVLNTLCTLHKSDGITVDISNIISVVNNIDMHGDGKQEGNGQLRNILISKSCELISVLLQSNNKHSNSHVKEIIDYVFNALECGLYSCIKWILSIVNILLPDILDLKIKFDVRYFLLKTWDEIEAIKTNKLYTDCIESFVELLLNDALLRRPVFNNIVISYCNKIVEYANVKNTALYYLVNVMEKRDVLKYSHIVYVFSDILLATAVPRKDQRITENVIVNLSKKHDFGNVRACLYTNFHIKYKSLLVLSKIQDPETLETIVSLIMKKIDELLKNKRRYHSNSTLHRTMQVGLQHILYLFLKHRSNYVDNVGAWSIEFLGRLPHQTSIRRYLEWYITLYYYYKGQPITDVISRTLDEMNVPILSQFMILYWLISHKISTGTLTQSEVETAMDFLLEHTMGPTYSIRMYAQYLSVRIYDKIKDSAHTTSQYEKTIKIITKTLAEAAKLKEKSFDRLTNDVLVHTFDIVEFLAPCSIYNGKFILEEGENEAINEDFALTVYERMIKVSGNDALFEEWRQTCKDQAAIMKVSMCVKNADSSTCMSDMELGTIQKKYIPWKNMSDIDVLDTIQNKSKSELIVVASLIDKLPNLGGMARTSEVFGVHTYVIDSVRHLQDKQFQGLSVSAERWVNVMEVRPGQPLKDYIMLKKSEGYSAVAAEQTSSSKSLQAFRFPKKTLLVLGHEKEGVPCDLLPFMDVCVEIPQQGVVRSLNVHVTAAIFIWEYSRQIIL